MRTVIIILIMCLNTFVQAQNRSKIDSRTVGRFDIDKYMGQWYEIARFNHPMERGLVGVTANYAKVKSDQVKVVNKGYDPSKNYKIRSVEGRAKLLNPEDPGLFRVSFFLIATTDYYILELDRIGYSYALIGNGSPDFLWILSRTPQIPHSVFSHLTERAKARGYDISKLIVVDQKQNINR